MNTWLGTDALVEAIVTRSKGTPMWTAARAGALIGSDSRSRVWMTAAEFTAWHAATGAALHAAQPNSREAQRRITLADDSIGIAIKARKSLSSGASPVSKMISVACAHVSLGLAVPDEPLSTWFPPRFGLAEPVAQWLEVHRSTVNNYVRGYRLAGGKRKPLEDDAPVALVRALDWVWRVGPVAPFGGGQPVEVFPA